MSRSRGRALNDSYGAWTTTGSSPPSMQESPMENGVAEAHCRLDAFDQALMLQP